MPLNPNGYPLDLTGLLVSNFITDEEHIINLPGDRLFMPSAGPFYHIGFSIRNAVTNQLLLPTTDYKLLHPHGDAMVASGKDVYCAVFVENPTITSVLIDYHVIGGVYSDTSDVIRTLLESYQLPNNTDTIAWGQIIDPPVQYTPVEHLHHIDEVYGFDDLVSVLEQLRVAILNGDGAAFNAVYQYIHQYIQNADFATRNELINLNSAVPFFEIKTKPDYATLRQATTMINDAPAVYACLGRDSMFDGNGRLFVWDISSTEVDNNDTVLKPNHIPAANNGRFLAILRVEKDLQRLASSVQRKINFDGTIEDGLIQNNSIVVGDCNNYVREGTYWVGDANVIANTPFSWAVMKVDNIVVSSNDDSYGEVIQTFYNGWGDKATRIRYYDVGSSTFEWSTMTYYARQEGDALVNFNVKDAINPDHAVNLRQLLNSETDCHLGIVVRYTGQQSVLLPCYIGESAFHGNIVKVYISNKLRTINLVDIQPIYHNGPMDGLSAINNYFGYVYLIRNPSNGVYFLYACQYPPETILFGNMTTTRKRLRVNTPFYDGNIGYTVQTEDTTFLGIAKQYTIENRWWMARSWFQDPGMVEWHGLYNSPRSDIESLPKVSGPLARLDFDDTNTSLNNIGMFRLWSPYYNAPTSDISMLCWGGEKIDLSFNGSVAIDQPNANTRLLTTRLALTRYPGITNGYAGIVHTDTKTVNFGFANAHTNQVYQGLTITESFVVPEDGVYALEVLAQTSNADTTAYYGGHHNNGVSRSVLAFALNQYHAYRSFVVAAITPTGQTLYLTFDNDFNNLDVNQWFNIAHGSYHDYPFLTDIVVNITNGAVIGSNYMLDYALYIPSSIPAGIRVTINISAGSYVVGIGGIGGNNYGSDSDKAGKNGGNAVRVMRAATINVSGVLAGGGGGGPAGRRAGSGSTVSWGGPGGGGAGRVVGQPGQRDRTTDSYNGNGNVYAAYAEPGQPGTLTQGGLGGLSRHAGPDDGDNSRGQGGGRGGDLGQPGTQGESWYSISLWESDHTPGQPGRAIDNPLKHPVTVNITGGQVLGAY